GAPDRGVQRAGGSLRPRAAEGPDAGVPAVARAHPSRGKPPRELDLPRPAAETAAEAAPCGHQGHRRGPDWAPRAA
ncbi:unnamed protein product, partial [Ectocarpus sp. 4 AP-2014]